MAQRDRSTPSRLVAPLERSPRALLLRGAAILGAIVVLPNAVLAAVQAFWLLPRPLVNLDYALVALLFPWLGATGAAVGTGILAMLDLAVGGAYHFHGNPAFLLQAAPDVLHLPPGFVAPYAFVLLGLAAAVAWAARRVLVTVPRTSGPNLVAALGALVLSLAGHAVAPGPEPSERAVVFGDLLDNVVVPALAMRTEYRGLVERPVKAAAGPVFDAAERGEPLPERIVLAVLESWGRFKDPELDHLVTQGLDTVGLDSLYQVERGLAPQFGGTVEGELRELCRGRSASVRPDTALLPVDECLPRLLGTRGYRTLAAHGFRGDMFDRAHWWPGLGFDSVLFRKELEADPEVTRTCGDAFEGICDADVVQVLARGLDAAAGPVFVYWLSLNAHPPYATKPLSAEEDAACRTVPAATEPHVCDFVNVNGRALAALGRWAARAADGRTAFILVGDHPTPFATPERRALVDPDSVPWVRLWPRRAPPP